MTLRTTVGHREIVLDRRELHVVVRSCRHSDAFNFRRTLVPATPSKRMRHRTDCYAYIENSIRVAYIESNRFKIFSIPPLYQPNSEFHSPTA